MTALLEAERVTRVFGKHERARTIALSDVSFSISAETPSFTAIVGESGSGKTTLARAMLGFQQPTQGEVRYLGKNVYRLNRRDRATFRREVQAIFQDPFEVYNPFYKVDHLLTLPIRKFGLAESRAAAHDLIVDALTNVGLDPERTLGRYPHQLSGGQRQRLTIARALLVKPRLIIADEPVSMVDASLRATILKSLLHLHEDFGISFVYITHDLATAYQVSGNVIVLYRGTVAEVGDVGRVIKSPQHPYTQLLVNSVPRPDPNQSWGETIPVVEQGEQPPAGADACPFAGRCPEVMPMCIEHAPALYRIENYHAAACFLHREAGDILDGDVSQVFRPREPASHT